MTSAHCHIPRLKGHLMAALHPYLNFPGTAREAMNFYQSVFGGELTVASYADFHAVDADHEFAQNVMHSQLVGEVVTLMAADSMPGMGPDTTYGNNVSLAFTGPEEELFRGWFDKLAEGGQVLEPIKQQVWGDYFGYLVDKFGMAWMFNIENPNAPMREDA